MNASIGIAADHAGYELKEKVIHFLKEINFSITDYGTHSTDSVDYPDFVHPMADAVENGKHKFGITLCGSGNGANMAANKHKKIRSALCWTPEIAALAKQHNNANIISLPARFIKADNAFAIIKAYIDANYEGGRHQRRVDKIN